jgi:hypothetical protein
VMGHFVANDADRALATWAYVKAEES